MTDKDFCLKLGRVMAAAASADGRTSNEEVNALKDLLFRLSWVGEDTWDDLQRFLERPVPAAEAQALLADLLGEITTAERKRLTLDLVRGMVGADGTVSREERTMLAEIEEAVQRRPTGLFGILGRLVGGAVGKQRQANAGQGNLDDYLHNIVYHDLQTHLREAGKQLTISEAEARKLCFAAGLMARVAFADLTVSEAEVAAIAKALADHWGLDKRTAAAVAEMSCHRAVQGLEVSRLCRGFHERTSADERAAFIKVLFAIANSADRTSNEEIDHIRQIANFLRVPHQQYIDAKLTVPREDRQGL